MMGVVASRGAFVALHSGVFGLNPLKWVDIFSLPGFAILPGILVGLGVLYRYTLRERWDSFEVLDFATLSLALSHALLWLGSFFAGTNFGNPTKLPWGMVFPTVFDQRHPSQLYGFLLYLALFIFLFWVESKYRTFEWYRDKRHSAQTGFLFSMFCIFYGFFGLLMAMVTPSQLVVFEFALDIPIRVVIMFFGIFFLFHRAGRTLALRRPRLPKFGRASEV